MAKGRTKKIIDITSNGKPQVSTELVKHIEEKNLPVAIQEKIVSVLSPVFLQLKDWDEKVESIEILDENDKRGMLTASESRKFVKATRIDIEKQVNEQIASIKGDMQPFLDNIEGWKTVFQFAEAIMKSIERKALEKEKYADNLKKKRIDDLRSDRAIIAEPLKQYIGFALDFGMISEEDFDKLIHNAKLAKKADDDEKDRLKKEEDDRLKELENEKRYTNRLNMVYSIGMKKGEGVFFYGDYHVLEDTIRNAEDFDTLFSGIEAKVNEIKAEEKKVQDEKNRIANEAAGAERARLQKLADNAKAAAEAKRAEINERISHIYGATIRQDGLYVQYKDDLPTVSFLIGYEDIYTMSDDAWVLFSSNQNDAWMKFNEEYRVWKEAQEKIRIDAEVQRIADQKKKDDDALAAKQEALKVQVQAEMSDKDKLDSLIKEIQQFSTRISNEFIFTSEMGNTIKNNVISLFGKIVEFIKQKK